MKMKLSILTALLLFFSSVVSFELTKVQIASATDVVSEMTSIVPYGSSEGVVAIDSQSEFIYTATRPSTGNAVLKKIRLSTQSVVATAGLNYFLPLAIGVSPDRSVLLVLNFNGSIQKFRTDTLDELNSTVNFASTNRSYNRIVFNSSGTKAYVLSGQLKKIDVATNTVDSTLSLPSGSLSDLAIASDDVTAYLSGMNNLGQTRILKINLLTETVTSTLVLGGNSNSNPIQIDSSGQFLYYASTSSCNLLRFVKINVSTFAISDDKNFTVPSSSCGVDPKSLLLSADANFAYVALASPAGVAKINLNSNVIISPIVGTDDFVYSSVITNSGSNIYALTWGNSSINTDVRLLKVASGSNENQTINFSAPSSTNLSAENLSLSATSSSELTVTYRSGTTSVCTVTGSTVRLIAYGSCEIIASQSGGQGWLAAVEVSRTFSVTRQVITFPEIASVLLGAGTVNLSATASSGLAVSFSSGSTDVCSVTGVVATLRTFGDCVIKANQVGVNGDAALEVSQTFVVRRMPPEGEVGISLNTGDVYTNKKMVILNIVWPVEATAVRVSNGGGFLASQTTTFKINSEIDWELDDSIKGVFTKVVYVRFNGSGIDTTKTYSDDIILDTTAPVVESSSATAVSGAIEVSLKATDDITGVDKVQIKNGTTTVTKNYDSTVSVTEKELGLTVSTASVKKTDSSTIEIRVSDKAGNFSAYQLLSVYTAGTKVGITPTVTTPTVTTPTVTTPTVTTKKSATAKSIATYAKLAVISTSKVSLKVVTSYAKYCKVSGATLKGLKAGSCKVTVTVTPKKGRATSKTVTLKVTK